METVRLQTWIRALLVICGLALIPVLFVPMWRIDLAAPQYPEGLRLLIYPAELAGNVDIINGLNHYIGMKTLHTADFIEFTVLPYCIGFFVLAFIITGIAGRRKLVNLLFFLFVGFGILAMVDFWRWEYNYGHNLNPDAAIVVPGMAYQPPLIGFKQLLNFGAYSIPDMGGWIFVSVGAVLVFCTVMLWRSRRKNIARQKMTGVIACLFLTASFASCNAGPDPIKTGVDNCCFCKMTISDNRFGAEIVTKKGKTYKFDDSHCILSFIKTGALPAADIKDIYLVDYCGKHELINVNKSLLLKSAEIRGPMGGDIAAFENPDSLSKTGEHYKGIHTNWIEISKQ